MVSVWSLHRCREAHSWAVPWVGTEWQEPSLCWGTGAWQGEQQSENQPWQQLTKSVGFLWRRPKHVALNIRHAAHTRGRLPDPARTDGWRTQGREPRAVTGATATIRLSYFAEIGLAMLMLLVPFQQGYAGASGGCDSAQQSCSSVPSRVPSPAPLPSSHLPACLACSAQGRHSGAGSRHWKRRGHGKENLNASKSGVTPMGTGFV